MLLALGLPANLLLIAVGAAGIWFAGMQLVAYADEISDRLKLGRALTGLIFLATATSLPEIVTTVVAAGGGDADLALNNLIGGITLQTAMLVVADGLVIGAALSRFPRKLTTAIEGALLALLIGLNIAIVVMGEPLSTFAIGLGSTAVFVGYGAAIMLMRSYDKSEVWVPVEVPEAGSGDGEGLFVSSFPDLGTRSVLVRFAGFCLIILMCGVLTVQAADAIAIQSGLGASFIGATLLAITTSLPELGATIAAARRRSYTLAISNIFGSNLVMLALIWPADLIYRSGPILAEAGSIALIGLACGLIVTLAYVIGLLMRPTRRLGRFGYDSVLVVIVYLVSVIVMYNLR